MLQVNHVMLNQNVVLYVIHMQLEPPGHRHFLLDREVNKVSDHLVVIRSLRLRLDWNVVGLVGLNGLLVDVGPPRITSVSHSDLFKCKISAIELVPYLDRRLERNRHIRELKGPVRLQHKDQTVRQLLTHLDSECAVGSGRGLDGSADI